MKESAHVEERAKPNSSGSFKICKVLFQLLLFFREGKGESVGRKLDSGKHSLH